MLSSTMKLVRQSLLRRSLLRSPKICLCVGAGGFHYDGWHSVEEHTLDLTSKKDWSNVCSPGSVSRILAEHVMEHLTLEEIEQSLENISTALITGGTFRMATPDGFHPSSYVRDLVKPGGLDIGSDDHKVLLDIDTLRKWNGLHGLRLDPVEYFSAEGCFVRGQEHPERGHIRRSADAYKGRFTDSESEMKRMIDSVPVPLREQFFRGGFSYTSLIVDWVKT